jgi:hypothetical protein
MVIVDDPTIDAFGQGELARYVIREEEFTLESIPLARVAAGVTDSTGKVLASPLTFTEGPAAGQVIPEAGVQQLPGSMLVYTWVDVPDLPRAAYATCVGKINASPFDGLNGTPVYPAESLLCLPWRTKPTFSVTGRVTWRIQFRFAFRPQLWNRYPLGTAQGFYKATFGGAPNGPTVYETADFSELFRVPPPVKYLP